MKSRFTLWTTFIVTAIFAAGCASRVLQYDKADQILKNDEYEKKIQIKETEPPPPLVVKDAAPQATGETPQKPVETPVKKPVVVEKKPKKTRAKKGKADMDQEVTSTAHLPEMEDGSGFIGRRPVKDPFRVGEKVSLYLSYFNVVAGTMDLEVKPMAEVNGEKAYKFVVSARSNSFFNHIYGVDDQAVTYLSYDKMIPLNLQITIKESKQLVEARTFFDWKTLKASYWQKRVTEEHGEESKKLEWQIEKFSQNVISAVYYLRTFQYEVGKKLAFRVADEGKNIVFRGEVLRKEKLKTEIGTLDTIVLKPELTVDGVFTPVGEILFWLTDDDRKFVVRIESKIKIGTIVAKLKSIEKGQE